MQEDGKMSEIVIGLKRRTDQLTAALARLKILLAALLSLIAYILISTYFPLPNSAGTALWPFAIQPTARLVEFRSVVGSALISFFSIGAIVQILMWSDLRRDMEDAMRGVLASNADVLSALNRIRRQEFIKSALVSLIGKEEGLASYHDIRPQFAENAGFRHQFEYAVRLADTGATLEASRWADRFSVARYRWVYEDLAYKAYYPAISRDFRGPLRAALVFDRATLSTLNADQEIFARFLIDLDATERSWLANASEDEIKKFVSEVFNPKITELFDDGREQVLNWRPAYSAPVVEDTNTSIERLPYVMIEAEKLSADDGGSKCRIQLGYPYSKEATYFAFSVPQPVKSPKMAFSYAGASVEDVEFVSYLSCEPSKVNVRGRSDTIPDSYEVSVPDCWVFPTGGVTFFWKNRRNHD
jgi:hypothetical protein